MSQTEVRISRKALLTNYKTIQEACGHSVWPVVKSNAYGHGLEEVVGCISHLNPEYIIVQNLPEVERVHTIHSGKVLLLGVQDINGYKNADYSYVVPVISSLDILNFFCTLETVISFHLKINTGMNRQGLDIEDIEPALELLQRSKHMHLVGIMTHFGSADEDNRSSMYSQEKIFEQAVQQITVAHDVKWIHANNSAGSVASSSTICNASRAGIALYGLSPFSNPHPQLKNLEPALSFVSTITQTRTISADETIGYGDTFKANKDMTIGVLPVGYYEGIPRSLSNKWSCVDQDGQECRVIGRISMNILVIDLSRSDAQTCDNITIFSDKNSSYASVDAAAKAVGTINYEITTRLHSDIPRVVL